MGIGLGEAEEGVNLIQYLVGDGVFEPLRFIVHFGPIESEDLHEE